MNDAALAVHDGPCDITLIKKGKFQDDDVAVVIVAVNEMERLQGFFHYYNSIGVNNFWFIDNGSTDGTLEYLKARDDVTLFSTTANYSEHRKGLRWSRAVSDAYLVGKWVLTLDVDELFIWPGYGDVPFASFLDYLDEHDFVTAYSLMVDFFPEKGEWADFTGVDDFFEVAGSTIWENYEASTARHFPFMQVRGGIRKSIVPEGVLPPILQKMPLIKWSKEYYYLKSTHYASKSLPIADVMCALAHFKFSGSSQAKFQEELDRGQRWGGGGQYTAYLNAVSNQDQFYASAEVIGGFTAEKVNTYPMVMGSPQYIRAVAAMGFEDAKVANFPGLDLQGLSDNWRIVKRMNSPEFVDVLMEGWEWDTENISLITS